MNDDQSKNPSLLKLPSRDLSVVIVTFNCKDYALDCIRSLFSQDNASELEIIIVDNASRDDTVAALHRLFPSISIIQNTQNLFFRRANNQGILQSTGRYVLLLNPDTALLAPNTLNQMIAYMDKYQQVGILGPKLLDSDGATQLHGDRFPGLLWVIFLYLSLHQLWPHNPIARWKRYADWDRSDTREVDSVSGAAMMVRRKVFEEIGLLDESSLMYWEEADFCRAAHQTGWKTVHFADAKIMHHWTKGGTSTVESGTLAPLIEQSMLNYYKKYYGNSVYIMLSAFAGFRKQLRIIFSSVSRLVQHLRTNARRRTTKS